MKTLLALITICALAVTSVSAQTAKTTSKMVYHGGPVLTGVQDLYVIMYGDWSAGFPGDPQAPLVITDFLSTIGNTPYMWINLSYPDASGKPATSALVYAGSVFDRSYSHGTELTDADIQGIIADQISNSSLPQDPIGIYIVIASADISSNATGFCIPGEPPYHARGLVAGGWTQYIFLGNPNRCPSLAPQFFANGTRLPTPHDSFAGDTIASNLAHALDAILTNPLGNGWFDRYGLENADKCQNSFGETYLTSNGARANIHLWSAGDYLIQQNWVNDRRGRCAMFP